MVQTNHATYSKMSDMSEAIEDLDDNCVESAFQRTGNPERSV